MTRKLLFFFNILAVMVFMGSCSTEVDLYDDYEDITIVYGLLDYKLDTNYIRIGKAFMGYGNAEEIAQIADSCNYPGKLDAKLIETQTNRVIELDTITLRNKETGIFYNDVQPVYYTTENINPAYSYKLEITKPDGSLVTSSTGIVGGESFKILTPNSYNFSSTASKAIVKWAPANNAALYEVLLSFNWEENGQKRVMKWSLGTYRAEDVSVDHGILTLPFNPGQFFNNLRTYLGNDTLNPVERKYRNKCFNISISAGGSDLATYIESNTPSSSIAQSTLDWTNINNGYGVFSSRINIQDSTALSSTTVTELIQKGWGFVKIE